MANRVQTTVAGRKYRFPRIRPDQVVMVAARLMPMFAGLKDHEDREGSGVEGMLKIMGALSPADWEFILATTFRRLEREAAPGQWNPVWSHDDGTLLFGDIGLPDMLQLVVEIIQASAESTIAGLPLPERLINATPAGAGRPN